jgi:hypothetical protein
MIIYQKKFFANVNSGCKFGHPANEVGLFKGIVSRDWGRLQMVLLDRSEASTILLNILFSIEVFKMASVRVRFSPGFPLGEG